MAMERSAALGIAHPEESGMAYDQRMTMLARAGFAARGLVYILIGWFALDVAMNGGKLIDNQGALGTLWAVPMGQALLAVCSIGFVGYAIWRLTEAIMDPENRARDVKGRIERAGYAMSGMTHIFLATAAGRLAFRNAPTSDGSPGDESAQSWSAWLLEQPGGAFLGPRRPGSFRRCRSAGDEGL